MAKLLLSSFVICVLCVFSNDHTGFKPPIIEAAVMNESSLFKLLFLFTDDDDDDNALDIMSRPATPLLADDVDDKDVVEMF